MTATLVSDTGLNKTVVEEYVKAAIVRGYVRDRAANDGTKTHHMVPHKEWAVGITRKGNIDMEWNIDIEFW
jgi:hypothetical protein